MVPFPLLHRQVAFKVGGHPFRAVKQLLVWGRLLFVKCGPPFFLLNVGRAGAHRVAEAPIEAAATGVSVDVWAFVRVGVVVTVSVRRSRWPNL